jgi:hypothetical protein
MKDCPDCAAQPDWPGYSANCPDCTRRALTHAGVWDDDCQIDGLAIWRHPILGGMLKVEITEVA